jgi:hypothetical protein
MIVIFAREDDRHACAVADILARNHREQAFILDMSLFPGSTRLTATFCGNDQRIDYVDNQGRSIDMMSVRAFWWRRPQLMEPDQRIADHTLRNFAVQEAYSALHGGLRCCPGLWVNDIGADQSADFKPRQLAVLKSLNLPFPETLITNNPDDARDFFDRLNGDVIYKTFNQYGIVWVPTRRLMTEDLAQLEHLPCAPVIFQRHVAGVKDIRATVIGDDVFATEFAIESAGCVDHRLIIGKTGCAPHRLPAQIEQDIMDFVRALKLEYAGVDLRLTHEGRYIFFELNTAGEFLYLQDRTGQPLAAAVASHLASGRRACRDSSPHFIGAARQERPVEASEV